MLKIGFIGGFKDIIIYLDNPFLPVFDLQIRRSNALGYLPFSVSMVKK